MLHLLCVVVKSEIGRHAEFTSNVYFKQTRIREAKEVAMKEVSEEIYIGTECECV